MASNHNAFWSAVSRHTSVSAFLARYDLYIRVEDVEDIRFWECVLQPFLHDKKYTFKPFVQKSLSKITGKCYILKELPNANSHYLLCVDSDFDFLLDRQDFDIQHFLFQTYTYSWENHYVWADTLQAKWQESGPQNFDFRVFLQQLSRVIYLPLVILLHKKKKSVPGMTLSKMCSLVTSVQPTNLSLLENNGTGLNQCIDNKLTGWLSTISPEPEHEVEQEMRILQSKGLTPDTAYLFMQGHCIYDVVCRVGCVLSDHSFEYQVLIPSFSLLSQTPEINRIENDMAYISSQWNGRN